ncbi:hypothetical protein D9M69_625000 [compost metagenome]
MLRLAEATASGRSLPALICAMAEGTDDTIRSTLPASTSIMAALEPLYGTWRILILAAPLKISPARWMVVPLPGEP